MSPTTKLVINLALAGVVLVVTLVLLTYRPEQSPPEERDRTDRLGQLRSLPYTAVTDYDAEGGEAGVLIRKSDTIYQGYNLFCSRLVPEVYLMDMEGAIVHTWARPGDDIWVWDRAVMQPDGDIIVINKFKGLLRLGWDSEVLWRRVIAAEARRSGANLRWFTPEHHSVRDYAVTEIAATGAPVGPSELAVATGVASERLGQVLDQLEQGKVFLFRTNGSDVDWAYPVTAASTGHRIRLDSGERFFAA